ncbi:hypothetical protein BH10PSE14_BH10PSE14_06340 [soil metagenome]
MKRFRSVIGEPAYPQEEQARRAEEFLARWRPLFDAIEAFTTPVVTLLGALCALAMVSSFVVAIVTAHRVLP